MPRVVHFEIHAADPERVADFYRRLFGWEIVTWAGSVKYRLVTTGPATQAGINGGLVVRRGPPPADGQAVNAYVCTIEVDAVDETVSAATGHGRPAPNGDPGGRMARVSRGSRRQRLRRDAERPQRRLTRRSP